MPRKKVEVVDETKNIALALKALCEDKGLPTNVVVDAMSEALKKAYFKFSGDYPDTIIKVDIDLNTGNIKMAKIKNVVAEIEDDVFETDPEEAFEGCGSAEKAALRLCGGFRAAQLSGYGAGTALECGHQGAGGH